MPTSIIYLIIDHDSSRNENEGIELTPEELHKQGSFVNDDAAGVYGYEGWNTIFDASDGLLRLIADNAQKIGV